jgi:hypothetical protein
MDGRLALCFACPVCGQVLDGVFDFVDEPALVVACMPCQTRFRVYLDGMVKPLNRDLPGFAATPRNRPPDRP